MRVTFVFPQVSLSGGIRVLATYADRLHRRGHVVTVVSLPPATKSTLTKLKSLVRGRGWPKNRPPEPSYFDGAAVPNRVLETARPIVDEDVPDADIVLATFWKTAPWVAALSPRKGAKAFLLQGYETSPGSEDPRIDAAWRLPLEKIVISKWMVNLARERFGNSNVYLVLNSVDTSQFYAPARGKQAVPTVGMLYSTLHLKGNDVALAALQQLRKQIGNVKVVAFGAEPITAQLPLPDWCEFHYRPPQDQIRQIYAMCDVWLCASRREGFHLPPLEAMACRCPVVSTSIGGPLDTVRNGVNGFLVEVEDASGLVNRLATILALDDVKWRQMSDAALETATRYTWDDATDILEGVLREIVSANKT
jgi:glycosyltransferase involved in cell wall biosynthesis